MAIKEVSMVYKFFDKNRVKNDKQKRSKYKQSTSSRIIQRIIKKFKRTNMNARFKITYGKQIQPDLGNYLLKIDVLSIYYA